MTRHRWIIAGLLVLAVAVAVPLLWPRAPRPCRATFEQVREGMTLSEVEAVVGGRPGDYTTTGFVVVEPEWVDAKGYDPPPATWTTDDAELSIYMDAAGRVDHFVIREVRPIPDNLDWLERMWNRLSR